jgi:hypothetical protein
MYLYPRLPQPSASALAESLRRLTIEQAEVQAAYEHPDTVFTPTGGNRIEPGQLRGIRDFIMELARNGGYPSAPSEEQRLNFDAVVAVALHDRMRIAPAEAAKAGVWSFLTCVLLPDVVRWRFPGGPDGSGLDRFLPGRRNTFQRLWWRAFLLHDATRQDHAFAALVQLGEDEIVQIMERPNLAGSRRLTHFVARELVAAAARHPQITRRDLIREAQKRLLRLSAFVSFDTVEDDELAASVHGVFEAVAAAVP